jgi:hypothetical protein
MRKFSLNPALAPFPSRFPRKASALAKNATIDSKTTPWDYPFTRVSKFLE